jgi:hypothetical protein
MMANASRKHMGPGSQGKGAGVGAKTEIDKDQLTENMVLSNRDKAGHSEERGLDSKTVENEQYQDQSSNRL